MEVCVFMLLLYIHFRIFSTVLVYSGVIVAPCRRSSVVGRVAASSTTTSIYEYTSSVSIPVLCTNTYTVCCMLML